MVTVAHVESNEGLSPKSKFHLNTIQIVSAEENRNKMVGTFISAIPLPEKRELQL